MAELEVWTAVAAALRESSRVAILATAAAGGSFPGRVGSVMMVDQNLGTAGTIGGGALESGLLGQLGAELAEDRLAPRLVRVEHRPGAPAASGMLCGGHVTVAIAAVLPACLGEVEVTLATLAQGLAVGWQLTPAGWQPIPPPAHSRLLTTGSSWSYAHRGGPRGTVHLIGGGHVNLALSRVLVPVEFRVEVHEERSGTATFARCCAHDRHTGRYEDLCRVVTGGPQTYAVIATHAPERDRTALGALLPVPLAYLGLLGSRAKLAAVLGGGPRPEHLYAPAGLPIGSSTPEEIALSIAAQLVAVRSLAEAHGQPPGAGESAAHPRQPGPA